MHGNSDDEHEGERPAAPPRATPPGTRNLQSQTPSTNSCTDYERTPDNEPNSSSRSMAVPPKNGQNCASDAPSQAHMTPSPPAPPAPPAPAPSPTMASNDTENTIIPSVLLPLLRCALCRLLLVAPTTLNCGHTVCSKHMDREDSDSPPGQCPVEGCGPQQPTRVRVLGPIDSRAGVTFTPAAQPSSSDSAVSTSSLGRVVKLDVTISKLLEVITTAARRNTAPARTSQDSDDDQASSDSDRPSRPHPSASFEKELLSELTCEICFLLLCNPITTPCQHTFCSTCLERSLDHSTKCPLCRLDLPPNAYFYQHAPNEVIVQIIAKSFPKLLEERIAIADTDGRDSRLDTPIFVCQLSYPGMPTLLHFFEPRYRLMLRRCLASPTPRFGMVMPRQNANNTDGNDYGTMLEIKNVQMLSDGRSMVETYGTFRFRILERGTLDGYLVGRTERIDDYPPEVEAEIERIAMMNPTEGDLTMRGIERSNQELVDVCRRFLDQLRNGTAPWVVQRLNNTYGPMPNDVASFSFWVALVLPIDEQEKAKLLPIRSPRMRLRLVVHWIEQLNNNWWFSSGTWIILQLFRR
ncbi:unnamed protein product [Rhizoctonia solani]|uniref:LON peptidase N-terminal domain and RING finger protein 1 n=1 Tax=Rhizoctonia solani TaxID=456999 RepID=A0A8H3DW80_9AGAM|nr:unnamed protein product [Rhizoctonia solani]